jgi:predicted methyltransferase
VDTPTIPPPMMTMSAADGHCGGGDSGRFQVRETVLLSGVVSSGFDPGLANRCGAYRIARSCRIGAEYTARYSEEVPMFTIRSFGSRAATVVLAVTAAATLGAPAATQELDAKTAAALDAALAGAHRSEANRARDRWRHPKETLAFFGFRSDMTVVEMLPGGGWYTEVLAPALKGSGKLYAAHNDMNGGAYARRSLGGFLTKLGSAPDVYGEVEVTTFGLPDRLEVAPPGSADLVVTFRNVHNWFEGGEDDVRLGFKAMYDALKPGGILGVVDHRWPDPATEDPSTGYISEAHVTEIAESVGFELVASSDINRNPKDTHDHPEGVWTLPPTLRLGDQDREKYLAIGESDRFTLKFVKPEAQTAD